MNALSKQPPRTDLIDAQSSAANGPAARRIGWVVGLFGFCCLMPYVAMPIGNNSAVQVGNVLTLILALPIVMVSWRRQPFWVYPLLLAPMALSMLKVAMLDQGDVALSFKVMVYLSVSLLTLLPTQLYGQRYSLQLLTGIAIAAIVHTIVGVWQWRAFAQGYLPLASFYANQSFLSVKDNAKAIVNYTQRPFGFFPEPSAMSASLAPWVLFWIAEGFGLVRLKEAPAPWQRVLFGIAAAGGLGLIILSRSGHAMITVVVVVAMASVWFIRCRATLKSFLAIVSVCWIALPIVLMLAAIAISDRLGGGQMGNSSWQDRSQSLLIGFKLFTGGSLFSLVFGLGPGQTVPILQGVYGLEAVWSVSLVYLYENGLAGMAAMSAIAYLLLRNWKRVRFDFVFAGIVLNWLVAVTVTTSYGQLLSLWVTLGFLTIWPRICDRTERVRVSAPPKVLAPPSVCRRPRWSHLVTSGGGSQ